MVAACSAPQIEGLPISAIAYMPTRADALCAVTEVVDGDTVKVFCKGGGAASVRLVGYDTPETYRPRCTAEYRLGKEATGTLRDWLRDASTVGLDYKGTDRYQRVLAEMFIDGQPVAARMISAGLAVANNGERRIDWCQRLGA